MVLPLSHLEPGEQGRIVWIASEPQLKHRLFYLGFLPEETLTCTFKGLRGYIRTYRIGDSLITLRKKTANEIFVEIL